MTWPSKMRIPRTSVPRLKPTATRCLSWCKPHNWSTAISRLAKRTSFSPDLLGLGPSYGLYGILDFIVDNLLPIVRDFREELQQLEQDIFAETFKRSTVRRLYDMQRDLMTLRLAVAPLQDIISQLVRLHPNLIPDKLRAYFRDVYDHVFRVNESINAMREMLTAAINVNLSLVTFGQNEVMKKLAGWAAMLAAPTLLTSWYGMNFQHMPELTRPWAYPAIIGVTLCSEPAAHPNNFLRSPTAPPARPKNTRPLHTTKSTGASVTNPLPCLQGRVGVRSLLISFALKPPRASVTNPLPCLQGRVGVGSLSISFALKPPRASLTNHPPLLAGEDWGGVALDLVRAQTTRCR